MKHGRHASDYDKIRKASGLAKPKYEFENYDKPDPAVDRERVQAAHDDFKERMAVLSAHEKQQEEAARKRATEFSLAANKMVMLKEYQSAGVEPPYVDADGAPKFSLGFLFRIGWSIAFVNDKNVLVSPIAAKGK